MRGCMSTKQEIHVGLSEIRLFDHKGKLLVYLKVIVLEPSLVAQLLVNGASSLGQIESEC